MVKPTNLISWREACRRLGIKQRALQYAVARGEIVPVQVPIKGRKTSPHYHPEDVRALKRRWETEAARG